MSTVSRPGLATRRTKYTKCNSGNYQASSPNIRHTRSIIKETILTCNFSSPGPYKWSIKRNRRSSRREKSKTLFYNKESFVSYSCILCETRPCPLMKSASGGVSGSLSGQSRRPPRNPECAGSSLICQSIYTAFVFMIIIAHESVM